MNFVVRNVFAFLILVGGIIVLSISAAQAAGGGGAAVAGGYEYVELAPLLLPIVDDDGVSQIINLVVSLEIEDPGAAIKAKAMKPKLTDAFIQDMYGVLNRHAALKGGVLQVGMIKKRLHDVSNEVMGGDHDAIHDVLLQVVQQRPI